MNPKRKQYLAVAALVLLGSVAWVVFSLEIKTPVPVVFWQLFLLVIGPAILIALHLIKKGGKK